MSSKNNKPSESSSRIKVEHLEEPKNSAFIKLNGYLQRQEANDILMVVNSLQNEGVLNIVFDMTEVTYANSSAIGAFVNSASSLKAVGGRVILLGMQEDIKRVFDTLGLLAIFKLASTREEALNFQ